MDKVEVELSHPYGDHAIGDRVELEVAEAKKLVRAGVAVYPTLKDARAAEGEAGESKTKRAVKQAAE